MNLWLKMSPFFASCTQGHIGGSQYFPTNSKGTESVEIRNILSLTRGECALMMEEIWDANNPFPCSELLSGKWKIKKWLHQSSKELHGINLQYLEAIYIERSIPIPIPLSPVLGHAAADKIHKGMAIQRASNTVKIEFYIPSKGVIKGHSEPLFCRQ